MLEWAAERVHAPWIPLRESDILLACFDLSGQLSSVVHCLKRAEQSPLQLANSWEPLSTRYIGLYTRVNPHNKAFDGPVGQGWVRSGKWWRIWSSLLSSRIINLTKSLLWSLISHAQQPNAETHDSNDSAAASWVAFSVETRQSLCKHVWTTLYVLSNVRIPEE